MLFYSQTGFLPRTEVGQVLFKKMFFENSAMSFKEKDFFSRAVQKITVKYSLKPDLINIPKFQDEAYCYEEILVIEVQVAEDILEQKYKQIASFIMSPVPYPMILLLCRQNAYQVWLAHQRLNTVDKNKNIIENYIHSHWFENNAELPVNMRLENCRQKNLFVLYDDLINAVIVNNARQKTGIQGELSPEKAKQLLQETEFLEEQIQKRKAQLKKEKQFNHKVALNLQIKELEKKKNLFGEKDE